MFTQSEIHLLKVVCGRYKDNQKKYEAGIYAEIYAVLNLSLDK